MVYFIDANGHRRTPINFVDLGKVDKHHLKALIARAASLDKFLIRNIEIMAEKAAPPADAAAYISAAFPGMFDTNTIKQIIGGIYASATKTPQEKKDRAAIHRRAQAV